jgi:hypothetical protein
VLCCIAVLGGEISAAELSVSNLTALQNALSLARNNGSDDTITISPGTYRLSSPLQYNPQESRALTIQGDGTGPVILDGGNATQLLVIDTTGLSDDGDAAIALVDLTLRNGKIAAGTGVGGARIKTKKASIAIEACRFSNNIGNDQSGGGLYASTHGGAIIITHSYFTNNSGPILGGGLSANTVSGPIKVRGCQFYGNASIILGGGAYMSSTTSNNIVTNTVFRNNSSDTGGGLAISTGEGTIALTNNTVIENTAVLDGGGLSVGIDDNAGEAKVFNNIVWGNQAGGKGNDIWFQDDWNLDNTGSAVAFFHNVAGSYAFNVGDNFSSGNILKEEPLLTEGYHLQDKSPCIDAGDNQAPFIPKEDFEGNNRIIDGDGDGEARVDMGVSEFEIILELPNGQFVYPYLPAETPQTHPEIEHNEPFAVGKAAQGNLTLHVGLLRFEAPVDIYLILDWSPLDSENIYLLTSGNQLQTLGEGVNTWMSGVNQSIDEILFRNVVTTGWPAGLYYLGVMVTPVNDLDNYYLWYTYFAIN